MEKLGTVYKNVSLPDKVTGQPRQVDVWWEIEFGDHKIRVLVDAKLRKYKVDVKDVEEVLALGNAVGANKCVLVVANGWTKPANSKAQFSGLDLKLLSVSKALELVVKDKWRICPACANDCIILDSDGKLPSVGGIWWWLAGRCRECKAANLWCQECGINMILSLGEGVQCHCGHWWWNEEAGLLLKVYDRGNWITLCK